ncbi:hypothetical protein HK100_001350 [Physocladia obscura]|uniref:Uncharacterized protein n=1 Tax=Physocladia obscura TaxID=109957 RepID=A0AAD5SX95_9FUNG|nr:hypothetical protein HK100_001350 [Physocladia obscura]
MPLSEQSGEDVASKYIALLEEHVDLNQQLNLSQTAERETAAKLEAAELQVISLQQQVDNLTAQLRDLEAAAARSETSAGVIDSISTQQHSSTAAVVDGTPSYRLRLKLNLGSSASTPFDQSVTATASRKDSLGSKRLSGTQSAADISSAKRAKLPEISSVVSSGSLRLSGQYYATPNSAMVDTIEKYVIKRQTGSLPTTTSCIYCGSSLGNSPSEWNSHLISCNAAPEEVRTTLHLINTENDNNASSLLYSSADVSATNEAAFFASKDEFPTGTREWNESIDSHVTKRGLGLKRVIICNYCNNEIMSNHKVKWQRHMVDCTFVPTSIQQIFLANVGNSSPAPTAKIINGINSNADMPVRPNSSLSKELAPVNSNKWDSTAHTFVPRANEGAVNGVLAEYPCPPDEFLPNGQPNTEGWRAWVDVMRYQLPNFKIEAKTGINVTKFKRLHGLAEIRMMPRSKFSVRLQHSNLCSAIPEKLHAQFLEFMEPRFVAIKNDHGMEEMFGDVTKFSPPAEESSAKAADFLEPTTIANNAGETSGKVKYVELVRKIIPAYKTLSEESRKAVKRGVKRFLEAEYQDKFTEECVEVSEKGTTFVIPEKINGKFQKWAYEELSRVFPEMVVSPQV